MSTSRFQWKNLPASALQNSAQLAKDWDHLNAKHGNLPFMAANAIVLALKILGNGNERLLIGRQNGSLVAMFLLTPTGKVRWQTFQPSQLPLGAWVSDGNMSLEDIAVSLIRAQSGICLVLSITQVDPHLAVRTDDTENSQRTDYIDTGWVDIKGKFEDYWSARGKNLRQNMRKQRVKLQADGVKVSLQVLRGHADMAGAVAAYGRLESAGWKAQNGTAIHSDNAQGRFYTELLECASLKGEAVVYQYLFDDRVVAINLCLQRQGTLVVLKTTYDESIQGLSPAFLLREAELQELHHDGRIHHLEYFGRFMDWHSKWTDQKRTLYHLTIYRWPLLKKLAEARRKKTVANVKMATNDADVTAVAQSG